MIAVHDIGTVVLHRQHDSVVLGHFAEFAHGLDNKMTSVALPKAVLVVAVRVIVRREAVIKSDPTPRSEELADWRAQILREPDALPHVADHRFSLDGHGTRQITVWRDCAEFDTEFAGEIA